MCSFHSSAHIGRTLRCLEWDYMAPKKSPCWTSGIHIYGQKLQGPECEHQLSFKGALVKHQQRLHMDRKRKLQCTVHQFSSKGSIINHHKSPHISQSREYEHPTTRKVSLVNHYKAVYMGKKFQCLNEFISLVTKVTRKLRNSEREPYKTSKICTMN